MSYSRLFVSRIPTTCCSFHLVKPPSDVSDQQSHPPPPPAAATGVLPIGVTPAHSVPYRKRQLRRSVSGALLATTSGIWVPGDVVCKRGSFVSDLYASYSSWFLLYTYHLCSPSILFILLARTTRPFIATMFYYICFRKHAPPGLQIPALIFWAEISKLLAAFAVKSSVGVRTILLL